MLLLQGVEGVAERIDFFSRGCTVAFGKLSMLREIKAYRFWDLSTTGDNLHCWILLSIA
jgi:hypothetical protein